MPAALIIILLGVLSDLGPEDLAISLSMQTNPSEASDIGTSASMSWSARREVDILRALSNRPLKRPRTDPSVVATQPSAALKSAVDLATCTASCSSSPLSFSPQSFPTAVPVLDASVSSHGMHRALPDIAYIPTDVLHFGILSRLSLADLHVARQAGFGGRCPHWRKTFASVFRERRAALQGMVKCLRLLSIQIPMCGSGYVPDTPAGICRLRELTLDWRRCAEAAVLLHEDLNAFLEAAVPTGTCVEALLGQYYENGDGNGGRGPVHGWGRTTARRGRSAADVVNVLTSILVGGLPEMRELRKLSIIGLPAGHARRIPWGALSSELQEVNLVHCHVSSIPEELAGLRQMRRLVIHGCPGLNALPVEIGRWWKNLRYCELLGCEIDQLPLSLLEKLEKSPEQRPLWAQLVTIGGAPRVYSADFPKSSTGIFYRTEV